MNTTMKRKNWVSEMNARLMKEEQNNPLTVGAVAVGRQVSVLYLDTERPKIGVAKCNPADAFDLATGYAIAYARANGKEIPDYVLHDGVSFKEVAIGTQFTHDKKRFIKLDSNSAYCYNDGEVYVSEGNEYVVVL